MFVQVDEDEVEAGRAFEEPLTLFVKNLSFSTKEAALRARFEREGLRVRSVSIPKRRGKGASEAMLSSGIGFVECSDANVAEKALTVRNILLYVVILSSDDICWMFVVLVTRLCR